MSCFNHAALAQIWMIFDLVRHQRQIGKRLCFCHQCRVEVRHTNVTNLASFCHFIQCTDLFGKRHSFIRPMQKQQIDILGLKLGKAFIDRCDESIMLIIIYPDFCGQKDVATLNAGSRNCFTDLGFIAINLRGIDMAKTSLERVRDDAKHIFAGHTESAKAKGGNGGTICCYVMHASSFDFMR
ncbi:hypothetical protein D9M68_728450 [compost metagenome]